MLFRFSCDFEFARKGFFTPDVYHAVVIGGSVHEEQNL